MILLLMALLSDPVVTHQGMVATSQPLAVDVGVQVLQDGGTAVDAAIAVNAMLGLTEPTGGGIGGDLFAIVWDNEKKELVGLNGSGHSPKGQTLEQLKKTIGGDHIPLLSAHAVSVPGCVDAWYTLHERYGELPMERLLQPAIEAATEGFEVSPVIAGYWKNAERHYKSFGAFFNTYLPDGKAPEAGEVFKNPGLARAYDCIAQGGREAFYEGEIANAISVAMMMHKGALTRRDLADHRSEWVEPVSTTYRGYEVWELPPNGQGIAALQMLNILEAYDLKSYGFGTTNAVHLMLEAKKLTYEDRARYYADPAMADVPVDALISKEYAERRRSLINLGFAMKEVEAGDPVLLDGDTVYLTVADAKGNVVSWIQSNYTGFGSGIVVHPYGFTLQNRGNLFHLDPEHRNAYAPGKRPFHTIIPAMVTKDGLPVFSFGVMGGAMQPQGHVQILTNIIDFGMNVVEAGEAPRWRHDGSSQPTGSTIEDGGRVFFEEGLLELMRPLSSMGHQVMGDSGFYGGYQAIWIDDIADDEKRTYKGASEPRKDGKAAGY